MKSRAFIIALLLTTTLAGCKTATDSAFDKSTSSMMGRRVESEARMSTAAALAIADNRTGDALLEYEKLYYSDRTVDSVAVNYAQLLRKTGKADKAARVLRPFIYEKNGRPLKFPPPLVLNEYAANEIALGHFEEASKILDRVLNDKKAADYHRDANNLQGVALDAQGQHAEAEKMFRMALDQWKGDKTSVMNNLALCLASQGKFDEALTILRQALIAAPHKEEVAENIQIVTDLRAKILPSAPVDLGKSKKKKSK